MSDSDLFFLWWFSAGCLATAVALYFHPYMGFRDATTMSHAQIRKLAVLVMVWPLALLWLVVIVPVSEELQDKRHDGLKKFVALAGVVALIAGGWYQLAVVNKESEAFESVIYQCDKASGICSPRDYTAQELNDFLTRWPDGAHTAEAKRLLQRARQGP